MPGTDFNGDGLDDILMRQRGGGAIRTWLADGDGFFESSQSAQIGVPADWTIVGTGDFNGDGNDDIAWSNNVSHQLGNWLGQDNGGWIVNDTNMLTLDVPSILGVGDFDGDGTDELLVTRQGDGGFLLDVLFTAPGGQFYDDDGVFGYVANGWGIAGIGDFNGDGNDDILWRSDDGLVNVYLAHAAFGVSGRGFTVNWDSAVNVPMDWRIVSVGDFNGDGIDDILWRHSSGQLGNWLGGEDAIFTINNDSLIGVPLEWHVAGVGDYDGDGRDDILWRNVDNGATGTWSGTDTGVFVINPEITYIATDWLVQPNISGAGEWDY